MSLTFPSPDFDNAVAAVCHGDLTEAQAKALGDLLRGDPRARDEYLRRVALHACLASETDLFAGTSPGLLDPDAAACPLPFPSPTPSGSSSPSPGRRLPTRALALAAAAIALLGAVAWWFATPRAGQRRGETSRAIAMLNRVVNARWNSAEGTPRLGAPLEPGSLRLDSGLAQIVFYNGARVVIEGPAELRLVSSTEAACARGTLTAEVPPQARGFRVTAPGCAVTDLGTAFGLKVAENRTEVHVFEGHVELRSATGNVPLTLTAGGGARVPATGAPQSMAANRGAFSDLFDLQAKSVAAEARLYDRWRSSLRDLRRDPSLWVHLDFEHTGEPAWRLPNLGSLGRGAVPDATLVGCEWREGRWTTKPALEFRGVSDRVRIDVPGELDSATLAAWVRVQGLDRQINSLFMSDGFLPGTLHWVIRHDGVLGLTVIDGRGGHQILASPPVMTLDQFGIWTHLAVVLDGHARQVTHYLNGRPVSRHSLRMEPPFRIGPAELGNWNPAGFPRDDPFMIRNFSGAMDEFCLFDRALDSEEVRSLHAGSRPQPDTLAAPDRVARAPELPRPHISNPRTP